MSSYIIAFLVGFVMIGLVAASTRFTARGKWQVSLVLSYLISTMWAIGVQHVANKGWMVGQAYAVGGALGTAVGIRLSRKQQMGDH